MPKFTIERQSNLNPKDAFEKIKVLLNDDHTLRKMDSTYKCQFDEAKLSGKAKGSKFSADMAIATDGTGCKVAITVDLPFLLTPFKGVVEETLQRKLTKILG